MPYRAILFEVAGLIALWSVTSDIRNGAATARTWTIYFNENPLGFLLVVLVKTGFVFLAVAVLLHSFGMVGDPIAALQQALPFLARQKVH